MSIDRAATLRQAEKLLRQGKLDQAIAEYQRLVDDQPRDWNTANLLGDLHVRAGHLDPAIEQFSRIAQHLSREGFLPKASALYKKILKLKPDADIALMQAGELAAQQGLLADARTFFVAAANGRRQRGDAKGALQVAVRLGALDPNDTTARLAAGRALVELEDVPGALRELNDVASVLIDNQREPEAADVLRQILTLNPGDNAATRELTRILIKEGKASDAASLLTTQAVASDDGLMLMAAELRLREGDEGAGLELVERLLSERPASADKVLQFAQTVASTQPDLAFAVVDVVVGSRIESEQWEEAAGVLRGFVTSVPNHVAALTRLVDVCVDGGLRDWTVDAQGRLADAYLATGAAAEAKYVAEDLVTRQPWDRAHVARLRSALAASGVDDPDRSLADWLAEPTMFGLEADLDASLPATAPEPERLDTPAAPATVPVASSATEPQPIEATEAPHVEMAVPDPNPHAIDLQSIFGREESPRRPPVANANVEEDLSVALDAFHTPQPAVVPAPQPHPPVSAPAQPPGDIESVFARLRDQAERRPADESSDVAYTRGVALFEAGELDGAVEQLRAAARAPRRRFAAASMLAKIFEQQKRTPQAIEWLGHAVDAPGISDPERFDALFRMADLLESSGEASSALAICLELQAEAGDYRDVAARIARLSRAQGGG